MSAVQTAPKPELLLDHRGAPKPKNESDLDCASVQLKASFHEAGHAVLAMTYGIHVVTSEIMAWTDEDVWNITGSTELNVDRAGAWQYAAMCAAGAVAEVQYLLIAGLWTPDRALACAALHDRELAVDVLARCGARLGRTHVPGGGRSWAQVRGMARRRVAYHWREIRLVAEAINERTLVTGEEIAAITSLTNPPRPEGGVA
ncbi:hypothetical protein ACN6LM_000906 [Streptomyces sp. SAS_281]|uniref:hypothetical protein n=1 Tax=Streptomyces sp. SAS_281 TaxID=3412744 RepID=UPI00403CA83B